MPRRGDQVTRKVLCGWMKKAQRWAHLKDTGALHILRHTFCSRLAMLGASTMAPKELAGHQDISTTQKYMHLSPAAKDAAISLLDDAVEHVDVEVPSQKGEGARHACDCALREGELQPTTNAEHAVPGRGAQRPALGRPKLPRGG